MMSNLVGSNVGRYHIIEKLGEGGMASVYKAYDTRLERHVAIKVITAAQQGSEQFLKRFEREAKALAKLTHANIVSVIDYGDENGLPYLVMEYLPGGTLKQYVGNPVSFREAARILAPVAWALEYAHQRQIIHRDVKPANILLTETGTPMLSDFGIAKMLDESGATQLTATGAGIGTPDYMSPEQSRGEAVDHRADIYSLGILFYELVTGRRPFRADTPMAVIYKHATEPLPRPRQFIPDLPEEVESVIFKALTKNPDDRYQRMGDFASALENLVYLPDTGEPAVKTAGRTMPAAQSTGASGIKLSPGGKAASTPAVKGASTPAVKGASTPSVEGATRTSPVTTGQGSPGTQALPQPKKIPWVWVGVGVGALVILCIAAAAVAGLWQPISKLIGGGEEPTSAALSDTKTPQPTSAKTPQAEEKPPLDTDCAKEEVICVGAVATGAWNVNSFNQSVQMGMNEAAEKYGIIPHFYDVKDDAQAESMLTKMADDQMDMIISVGYQYTEVMLKVAPQHPQIQFIGIDQIYYIDNIPANLVGVSFHEDQAGFLAGALAGMMTQTNSVGAVCGVDWIPPVWRFCEGFKAGALYVKPDISVQVVYYPDSLDSAFTNPEWGAEVAANLIKQEKVDVLFAAAGLTGTGALKQAAELNVYVIGVDIDQYYSLPETQGRMLSSAMKDVAGSVIQLIDFFIRNQNPGGLFYGEVLLAPYHDLEGEVPQDVKNKLEEMTIQIRNGELKTGVPESKDAQIIPVFRIATDPTWPPFEMMDENKNLVGFDIDLMKQIAANQNIQIEFVPVPFDRALGGVSNCEFDAAISAISWSLEREKVMLVSAPYFNDGQVVLVQTEDGAIQGKDDLKGRVVGVVAGTSAQFEAEKITGAQVLLYDNLDFLITDLINKNKIDAAIVYYSNALASVRQSPDQLKIAGDIFTEENYHIFICKDKPELVDIFNKGLANLISNGTLDKLVQIWLVEQ